MLRLVVALVLPLLCEAAVCGAQSVPETRPVAVKMTPDHIDVGTLYDGTIVQVSADLPNCEDAVVVLEGDMDELTLNRKGRVAGIWLNVAQVAVSGAPKAYILAASDDLDRICTTDDQRALHLGLEFLRQQITFECDRPLTGTEFHELVDLKKHRGTFVLDAPVSLALNASNHVTLSAMLPVSPTVPPGSYDVMLYGFSDYHLICSGAARLSIERIGLANWLVNLSRSHGALYGTVAIAAAILAGIVMGVIFHSLPRAGR